MYKDMYQFPSTEQKAQCNSDVQGHSRIVGPSFNTSLMSLSWHVGFGGNCYIFGKI